MTLLRTILRHAGRLAVVLAGGSAPAVRAVETLTVRKEVVGTTPVALGYNLGHFAEHSNAADWFRYSGADSARLFMDRKTLEGTDDMSPWGDGVTNQASLIARRGLLRANAANPAEPLSNNFVNWNSFTTNLAKGNGYVLSTLRDAGVGVLANITAGTALDAGDWAGRWELWQQYYAMAFLLSREYGVSRYSMFNEPNHGAKIKEEDWLDLLLVCSDAIQSAIQDMNARYGRSLKPEIFAPNTAGGSSKFNDEAQGRWGNTTIAYRHRRLDGRIDPKWMNIHIYNYQKYTNRLVDQDGYSGFLTDYNSLRGKIDAAMQGEPRLPISLTEFNVRTAASYDKTEDTLDSPSEFASLGATLAGLGASGMRQMYLFKFGQTEWKSTHGVKKNGTHFVQNSSPYNYGSATRGAEVYRLFIKAARGARPIHRVTASAGASPGLNNGLWHLATRDNTAGMSHLFLANRDDRTISLNVDFSALGDAPGNPFFIEQVNETRLGGVVAQGRLIDGTTGPLNMPPLSVWLISVPTGAAATITRDAVADTQLRDGAKMAVAEGGSLASLMVRSDASKNPRHVALVRIPVPTGDGSQTRRVLLEMDVASSVDGTMAQAHVYGIENNNWSERSFTWQQAGGFLKSGVPVGNQIKNNAVKGHGTAARILGQLAAESSSMARMAVDVTEFARSRKDGMATFLVIQEHRWDVVLPSLAGGDTQSAHLRIGSRERQGGQPPRLVAFVSGQAPVIKGQSQSGHMDRQFISPPREARPYTWWMWLGTANPPEAITRDLEEFHAKGLVGATIKAGSLGPVWYPEDKVVLEGKEYRKVKTDEYGGKSAESPSERVAFWSDENLAAICHAAKEANRLGMDLGLQIGTAAPREFVSNEFSQQVIAWSVASFKGPGVFEGILPVPEGKAHKKGEKRFGDPYHRDIITLAFPDKPQIKGEEVINISDKMDGGGRLKWNAPAGKWTIMRFVQIPTMIGNEKSVQLDGLSTEATEKGWEATVGRLLAKMTPEERKGLKLIEEDSWEAGHPTWTKTFPEEFRKRRGYDLLPFLPALAGRVIGDEEFSKQIRQDHQLTIDDLIADNRYAHRRKLANKDGLLFYAEAGGPNIKEADLLKNSSRVDVAMGEFWMPSAHRPSFERRFLLREAASANHIYGKKFTVCESFTSVGPHWEESPFSMKATGDQAFCDGLNRVAFHTASLSPSMTAKPGYTMWAGTHYEPGMTWWNQTPAFNTYLARCSYLLQQGLFAADVLFYQGNKSGYSPVLKRAFPTLGEGYDYDHCNTEALLTRLSVRNGRIVLPDGMSYRVLVLPDVLPMQLPALEKVASLINAGATVVGPRPTGMFGKPLKTGDTEKFEALVKRLWSGADSNAAENRMGSGRLVWGKTAREVLNELGAPADFEHHGLSDAGTIDWIHRTMADGAEIYFVASRWEKPESVTCTFRVSGKQPELWNPVTGERRNATAFRQENGRTMVPLEFGPCGSTFVIFRKAIGPKVNGTTAGNYPTLKPRLELGGGWDVSFDPKWGGPARIRFDELTDWTQHADNGIRFYSGTATYRKTFTLPTARENGRQLFLDLGEVREVAEVRVNGKDLGVVWTKPARVNITSAVNAGANELEVIVVNLWPNRLIGDAALPAKERFTETNMRKFVTKSPLLPSGLLGPVRILAEE